MDPFSKSAIWKEIDLAESYMVCCMFEEAASHAASVVHRIRSTAPIVATDDDNQLADMMESAGMVFVQSQKELGRTRELFVELEMLFGSVEAIPVQVFLTGACMQISEGYSSNLRAIFEAFLGKWLSNDDVLLKTEGLSSSPRRCIQHSDVSIEKYLEVAEVYAITLLGMVLRKSDDAIYWTERAALPDEKRQDMLRRLRSPILASESSSSLGSGTVPMADKYGDSATSGTSSAASRREGFPQNEKSPPHPSVSELKAANLEPIHPSIEHVSGRTFRLKIGNFQLGLPRRKVVLLGSLMLFTFYILRKRSAILKRIVARQASSIKKALIDMWQLAFSVQVNPLAAVQQLPAATPRGGR